MDAEGAGVYDAGTAEVRMSYVLDNAWEQAQRRLSLLHAVHDPMTFARLEQTGVGPGWRVFVPGAGAGSVARWLAARVTPGGHVLATDIDPRFLETDAPAGLEIRRHDIVRDPLPDERFDLIAVRLLLIHLPEREDVLARLISLLAPGGRIVLEEYDLSFATLSPDADWAASAVAAIPMLRAAGPDYDWARRLPPLLDRLGLEDVGGEVDLPFFRGGSTTAEFHRLTGEQARDALASAAADHPELARALETLERAQQALTEPDRWFLPPGMVAAWGRKPS
jgi:SAM-dependent methyltransferase